MSYFPPHGELNFEAVRSTGAGGQNINKTNSAAILRWNIIESSCPESIKQRLIDKLQSQLTKTGDLIIRSQESRDLEMNKKTCVAKLKKIIAMAMVIPKKRKATKPTKSSQRKRLDSKRKHGEVKSGRQKNWSGG